MDGRAPCRCEPLPRQQTLANMLACKLLNSCRSSSLSGARPIAVETKHASAWFGAAGSFAPLLKGTAGQMFPRHQNLITAPQLSSALPTSHICDFNGQRRNRDGRRMSLA